MATDIADVLRAARMGTNARGTDEVWPTDPRVTEVATIADQGSEFDPRWPIARTVRVHGRVIAVRRINAYHGDGQSYDLVDEVTGARVTTDSVDVEPTAPAIRAIVGAWIAAGMPEEGVTRTSEHPVSNVLRPPAAGAHAT